MKYGTRIKKQTKISFSQNKKNRPLKKGLFLGIDFLGYLGIRNKKNGKDEKEKIWI